MLQSPLKNKGIIIGTKALSKAELSKTKLYIY